MTASEFLSKWTDRMDCNNKPIDFANEMWNDLVIVIQDQNNICKEKDMVDFASWVYSLFGAHFNQDEAKSIMKLWGSINRIKPENDIDPIIKITE